jgi:hypothetical protein
VGFDVVVVGSVTISTPTDGAFVGCSRTNGVVVGLGPSGGPGGPPLFKRASELPSSLSLPPPPPTATAPPTTATTTTKNKIPMQRIHEREITHSLVSFDCSSSSTTT